MSWRARAAFVLVAGLACARRGQAPAADASSSATDPAATASREQNTAPKDRNRLTQAELLTARAPTLYDAIQQQRGLWLQVRGPDSFSSPSAVVVYLGSVRLGGVESLRTLAIPQVSEVRWLSPTEATGRYGVGHGAGAIVITPVPAKPRVTPPPKSDTTNTPAGGPRDTEERFVTADGAESESVAAAATTPGQVAYVATTPAQDRFPLSANGVSARLMVSGTDFAGVVRAARDLQGDIGRVSGATPVLEIDGTLRGETVVIAGTIGHNATIDALIKAGRLDVSQVAGRWEASVTQVVERPVPGVAKALVIAGSDKRGTIYGLYDLSAQIGVSPWHWWADVPVPVQRQLHVLPGRHVRQEPAVRYRGIFINDEAPAFSGWTREKFGGFNHKMYERMFELILRLKGNYLWPAMWGNAFADDDSLNAKRADEYGIVMGTSHHEPLTRAQAEWPRYGKGAWNYEQNDSTLRAFWRGGIARMGTRENIVTVGMRGDGDMPMTEGSNIALLERIVADQRQIITSVTGKPAAATPQLWALYKEVQDYYDKGMRVPDDITLLFADDNWGNIRRLPSPAERGRPGGFGVYYHFDYVGGPRNYKWLNTNPIARVWQQMQLAHEHGANRIWIVNVGDLKPMEFPISFFLDFAWNPSAIDASQLSAYAERWAAQQFGTTHAAEVAELITTYLRYSARRKPELLDPDTYSLTNFREAETIVADWNALRDRADSLAARMPAGARDAYYQLVLHPILANANQHELYVTTGFNRLYASQGRARTNALADRVRALFDRDADISAYYNTKLSGGKWSHMMDQTHIGYTYWQEPPRNVMPRVDIIHVPVAADMGVAVVEQNRPAPPSGRGAGGPPPGAPTRGGLMLAPMDPYARQTRHIDVFNRGRTPFEFAARAAQPWIRVTPAQGVVDTEQRLAVHVDWATAPRGSFSVPITITGPNNSSTEVRAVVHNDGPPRDSIRGFAQGEGFVSIEAEHASRIVESADVRWQRIPDLGRTRSGMTTAPTTAASQTPGGASPHLQYEVWMRDSGTVRVHAYFSPTLNFSGRTAGMRYAVSIDDEAPQVINIATDTTTQAWEKTVADNIRITSSSHVLRRPGAHVLRYWLVDPGVVLQKLVIDAGALPASYLGPPESYRRTGAPQ